MKIRKGPNRTVHVSLPQVEGVGMARRLMAELYRIALKNDPWFHYFYEGDAIVIRTSKRRCLKRVRKSLIEHGTTFKEYEYPLAIEGTGRMGAERHGEEPGGIVLRHFKAFMRIFHEHAVAAITMDKGDHWKYRERVMHSVINPRMLAGQEGRDLIYLAKCRLSREQLMEALLEQRIINRDGGVAQPPYGTALAELLKGEDEDGKEAKER